ncbi:hypothetical protein [Aquibacillus sediminis]|nr:hypothetical protein [Aquibacillus sediminis]
MISVLTIPFNPCDMYLQSNQLTSYLCKQYRIFLDEIGEKEW